ncbi:hypothetical protein JC221_045 [Yersinia phage JC221]|nr:hypothetical protein JC221_045 [Yersinia phage JC221]
MRRKVEVWETISDDPEFKWCAASSGFDMVWGPTKEEALRRYKAQWK